MGPSAQHNLLPVQDPLPAFWSRDKDEFHNHRTTADLPQHSDIVIIGAGYAGTATAWHLVKDKDALSPNTTTTILEARRVCEGATGRNGGHLRPDLYGAIPTYIERAGLEAALEVAEFEIAHVQAIRNLIREENIDCDFVLCRAIDAWANPEAAKQARLLYEEMMSHGFKYMDDVFFHDGTQAEALSKVKGAKAMASYTSGMLWPYKLITHLLKSLVDSGDINLQTQTPAIELTVNPAGGFDIETPRGRIHANKVGHANNAYVARLLPEYKKNIVPCKGICCRIAVPEGKTAPYLANTCVERNADKTSSYLIPRPDGSIIVGGSRAHFDTFRDQWYDNIDDGVLIEASKDYYDGYMQRTFRGWEDSGATVDQIWTGVMGYSFDSNPHVGAVPNKTDQYILAGFNGHGMPVIWLSAKGLARMINQRVPFEEVGVPRLFKTTQERIDRAQTLKEESGDIIGDGSLV